jgi:hypothetical protein
MSNLKILPDEQGDLYWRLPYVFYTGGDEIQLDGKFTADDLERLATYMRAFHRREQREIH